MRVALYPRVSGHMQEDNYSIPEQVERMRKYCESRDWVVHKIYTDSGYTGSNMERPGLQSLIKDVNEGKFDMVLVYKLDRLSRNQKDILYLVEDVFDKHGVYFVSMTENFDTSTPFGKAMMGILAVFAQLERDKIRERTMMGQKARAEEGKWHGSSWLPIGYDYENDYLVVNEYEAMQIREAVDLFLKHTPLRTITDGMNAKGYRHKHGEWSAKTLKRVLANPVYIGLMKHNDEYVQGVHTPILDKQTFDDIQAILKERADKYGTKYKKHGSLLGGMMYCKRCGAKFTRSANSRGLTYYCCYSRSKKVPKMVKDPNCRNKNHRSEKLDEFVLAELKKLSLDPNYVEQVRETKPINNVEEKAKTIKSEIDKISSQISNLMDLYALGNMPLDVINKKVTDLNVSKITLENELESLGVPEDKDILTTQEIQDMASLMSDDLDLKEKRNIISTLIYYIEIDGDDIYIHWKF